MELPCVALWRPEALDCRMFIPPEATHMFNHLYLTQRSLFGPDGTALRGALEARGP